MAGEHSANGNRNPMFRQLSNPLPYVWSRKHDLNSEHLARAW